MTLYTSELASASASMIERVGHDITTPATGPDTTVWTALADAGFTGIGIPEEHGGSGGTTEEALAVVAATAETGALTPLVEHMMLAARLAAECGIAIGERTATLASADRDCVLRTDHGGDSIDGERVVLDGQVSGVVHARTADLLVLLLEPTDDTTRPHLAVVATAAPGITVIGGTDLVGAPVDDLVFQSTPVEFHSESPVGTAELTRRGALAYSVALTAAARAIRDQTLRHATERTQFGRSLTKFQAIQQRLATLGACTAMMETATDTAATTLHTPGEHQSIAAAKIVTSAAAREIAAIAHQIHGAIGFTSEHRLGRFTTALWTWRDRYGTENHWADTLAGHILDDDTDVWEIVTGSSA